MIIDDSMWSPFQKDLFPDYKKKPTTKLSPNLYEKKKYVVHERNLKFYMEQGIELKKTHRVLEFNQSNWLGFDFPQKETYVGIDTAEHFLDYVTKVANLVYKKYIDKPKEMMFTHEDEKKFEMTLNCHICEQKLVRVIPHCHNQDENEDDCPMLLSAYNIHMKKPR